MTQSVAATIQVHEDVEAAAIRQTLIDYVESWQEGDPSRMERSVHPELAKRRLRPAEPPPAPWRPAGDWLEHMGALRLVQETRRGPRAAQGRSGVREVTILDRFANAVSVKLGTTEYHHLARWNGRWLIVNVLYGVQPQASAACPAGPHPAQRDADEVAIRRTALDYIESCYAGDPARMEHTLHPDLAKRIVWSNASPTGDRFDQLSALGLVQLVRCGPMEGQRAEVALLDHAENAASVRTDASTWMDYMHLARWNGRWVIVNVLWAARPEAPAS